MASLRFKDVSQPVFPNQRRDERIFVFSRRHPIDLLFFAIIIFILINIPIVALFIGYPGIGDFPESARQSIRAVIILGGMTYYGFLAVLTISAWISHYYNAFIVTDERIVEVAQLGLFSRAINELTFEQIEDVSTRTKGILNTLVDSGDIEIQTAGSERNFYVRRIPHADAAVEIINEIAHQARENISIHERFPQLSTIGLINGHLVQANGEKPRVMNLEANLEGNRLAYACGVFRPKNLRERFDYWWWHHCNQMIVTFGRGDKRQEVEDAQNTRAKKIGETDSDIEAPSVSRTNGLSSDNERPVETAEPRTLSSIESKTRGAEEDTEVHQIEEIDDEKTTK